MNNKNIDYLINHYNRFIYPRPIEDIDKEWIDKNMYYLNDPTRYWHRLWPEKLYNKEKLKILIAGCGTHQAAIYAKCNPEHSFVGIDLSNNSISHQMKLIEKHGIKNLKLICDDFRKIIFKEKFNLIISTGVIHHLENPGSALEYFEKNLENDGVISLMVYGNQSSYPINEIKKVLDPLKLDHDNESINCIQKLFERINPSHPAKNFLKDYNDLEYNSGIVDMFLHKSEKFFSIKELFKLLSNYNLEIKNLDYGKNLACTKFFINNIEKLKEIRKLKIEEQWQIGQILNWKDRKILVNCAKKNYLSTNKVNFNKNVREYYISPSPGTSYKISKNLLSLSDEEGENYQYNFNFKEDGYKILELVLNGKKKISTILNLYTNHEKSLLEDFFLFLLENSFVDKSLYPINDLNS